MRTRRLLELKDKRKGKLKLALRLCVSSAGKARRQGMQARHASEARKRGKPMPGRRLRPSRNSL